jgi:predicted deacylase
MVDAEVHDTSSTVTAPDLEIGGQTFPAGTRGHVSIPVLTDLDASEISLHVHVVAGSRPGPTLALATVLHGGEWLALEVALAILDRTDAADLAGSLVVVPVANPIAFASGTRNIVDESDSPDLNRSFGGEQAWLADQLGRAIAEHVLAKADAVIDFHCGLWGAAMGSVTCGRDYANPEVSARSYELARAFGQGHVRRGDLATRFPGPKSMVGYAGQVLEIPGIISEIGGAGFDPDLEQRWLEENVAGVQGVMRELGMLAGAPAIAEQITLFDAVRRVNPTVGGIVEPIFPPEGMMRVEIAAGELLGRVWSPYTFEVLEELRSPVRGLVDMVPRQYPVRPGDWAYLVVDLDATGTRTIGGDETP